MYISEKLSNSKMKNVQAAIAVAAASWMDMLVSEDGIKKKASKYMDLPAV
jgi:hypothetical protein